MLQKANFPLSLVLANLFNTKRYKATCSHGAEQHRVRSSKLFPVIQPCKVVVQRNTSQLIYHQYHHVHSSWGQAHHRVFWHFRELATPWHSQLLPVTQTTSLRASRVLRSAPACGGAAGFGLAEAPPESTDAVPAGWSSGPCPQLHRTHLPGCSTPSGFVMLLHVNILDSQR